jgi:LysM repeat protein
MDSYPSSPPPRLPADEGSYAMKAFFILVLFILTFFLVASTSLAGVDLTPDTPPADNSAVTLQQAEPQVIMIQGNTPVSPSTQNQDVQSIPVTGSCSNPYSVRSGDTLSQIAELCNTSVGAIRLANPQIANINLIYPGQQLNIANTTGTISTPAIPVTADKDLPIPSTQVTPTLQPPVPNTGSTAGILAGTMLRVQAFNFPANTSVNIGLGDLNGTTPTILSSGVTDPTGSLDATLSLPEEVSGSGPRTIVVYTSGTPRIQAASKAFQVIPR